MKQLFFPYTGAILIKNRGMMTLLEILIALIIIASVMAMGVSAINRKENRIKKTFRQFIALNRQLDHSSRLKRKTWRLVIQMDGNKNSWWVEQKLPAGQIFQKVSDAEGDSISVSDGFIMDTDFFEEPQTLPRGLHFESVEFNKEKEVVTGGKVYIHYFPEGQFSIALVKIKGRNNYWSLFIDRLHGELTVLNGKRNLKEFEQ